jgi:hypothetical protein
MQMRVKTETEDIQFMMVLVDTDAFGNNPNLYCR